MKRQATDWQKIFANQTYPTKDLYLEYIKTAYNSMLEEKKTIKWGEYLNRYFIKEDMHVANKLMKRCSITLVIRKL